MSDVSACAMVFWERHPCTSLGSHWHRTYTRGVFMNQHSDFALKAMQPWENGGPASNSDLHAHEKKNKLGLRPVSCHDYVSCMVTVAESHCHWTTNLFESDFLLESDLPSGFLYWLKVNDDRAFKPKGGKPP